MKRWQAANKMQSSLNISNLFIIGFSKGLQI